MQSCKPRANKTNGCLYSQCRTHELSGLEQLSGKPMLQALPTYHFTPIATSNQSHQLLRHEAHQWVSNGQRKLASRSTGGHHVRDRHSCENCDRAFLTNPPFCRLTLRSRCALPAPPAKCLSDFGWSSWQCFAAVPLIVSSFPSPTCP